jgi:hypothetical protein
VGIGQVGVEGALDLVRGCPVLGGRRGQQPGPIEIAVPVIAPADLGGARKERPPQRRRIERGLLLEQTAIEHQLEQAFGQPLIAGRHRDGPARLEEGAPIETSFGARAGELHVGGGEVGRPGSLPVVERHQGEQVAAAAHVHEVSGKQRDPSAARWCRPRWFRR